MRQAFLALLALSIPVAAQDNKNMPQGFQPNPLVDQKKVDQAIKKGVEFLKKSDSPGGGHGNSDLLKLLTLIHAGLPETDPVFQELLKKGLEMKLEHTYTTALLAMCLEEVDRVKYQYKLKQCGQFLIDNQRANGAWGYGEPTVYADDTPTDAGKPEVASGGGKVKEYDPVLPPGQREKPKVTKKVYIKKQKEGPSARSDDSNAQYAALGIRACHDAGIVFPKGNIALARDYWLKSQHPAEKGDGKAPAVATGGAAVGDPRGWCYNDGDGGCGHNGGPYGSMTAGAVGAVCIYDYILDKDWKKDKVVLDGLAWMDRHWSVTENPGPSETAKGVPNSWLYYYLYAVERMGLLYDTTLVGSHDWYLEGARELLKAQKPDGSWDASHFKHPTWDTCFAILFLKRATRPLVATEAGGAKGK